jgi:transposase-like protein
LAVESRRSVRSLDESSFDIFRILRLFSGNPSLQLLIFTQRIACIFRAKNIGSVAASMTIRCLAKVAADE